MTTRHRRPRPAFTMAELLVIVLLLSIVAVIAVPVVVAVVSDRHVKGAAAVIHSAVRATRDRASSEPVAGIRFYPPPSPEPPKRLDDGRIDPDAVWTFDRFAPLQTAPDYRTGRVAIHVDGFPKGNAPLPGRLVLEEVKTEGGLRVEPTSWYWNIRVGERLQLMGHWYTVVGPIVVKPDGGNPDLFVNVGPAGTRSPLDRGEGPAEYLYLVNGLDDDGDGIVDSGWNGVDDNLDGLIDDNGEWETERWVGVAAGGVAAASYRIARRPVADEKQMTALAPGVVIDATGWATDRERSRVPVNPYTGVADIMFDPSGVVTPTAMYATPTPTALDDSHYHLWVSDGRDVVGGPSHAAMMVSIDGRTGRATTGLADPGDPSGTFRRAEGKDVGGD